MEKITKVVRVAFGIPWLVVGAQHFIYVEFVSRLVPAFMPLKTFWAYFTGAAMIAAGVSFVTGKKAALAAVMLGAMLTTFIVLIHIPALIVKGGVLAAWTRPLQDVAIACAALMLASVLSKRESENRVLKIVADSSRYLFAALLIVFGIEQFLNLDFHTAKVAEYLPLRGFWVFLNGAALITGGALILADRKAKFAAVSLGMLMLAFNLLHHVYLLASGWHNALYWTGAMLDLAITCGAFVLALSLAKGAEERDVIL